MWVSVDRNVDSIFENPVVPSQVRVAQYWGPITEAPEGRLLRKHQGIALPLDMDVDNIWWPELQTWIDAELLDVKVIKDKSEGII